MFLRVVCERESAQSSQGGVAEGPNIVSDEDMLVCKSRQVCVHMDMDLEISLLLM